MLGYDISWSAFNIIEVMSSNKFTYKVREEEEIDGWDFIHSSELVISLLHNVFTRELML